MKRLLIAISRHFYNREYHNIYEFNILSEDEQWNTLWDKEDFLTNLKLIDISFSLYAIDKFFVEVELDPVTDR